MAEDLGFSQAPDAQSIKTVCQVARELQEQCGLQKLDSLRQALDAYLRFPCRFLTALPAGQHVGGQHNRRVLHREEDAANSAVFLLPPSRGDEQELHSGVL